MQHLRLRTHGSGPGDAAAPRAGALASQPRRFISDRLLVLQRRSAPRERACARARTAGAPESPRQHSRRRWACDGVSRARVGAGRSPPTCSSRNETPPPHPRTRQSAGQSRRPRPRRRCARAHGRRRPVARGKGGGAPSALHNGVWPGQRVGRRGARGDGGGTCAHLTEQPTVHSCRCGGLRSQSSCRGVCIERGGEGRAPCAHTRISVVLPTPLSPTTTTLHEGTAAAGRASAEAQPPQPTLCAPSGSNAAPPPPPPHM